MVPVLPYLLAFAGLAVLGAPLAALLFEALPRRGAPFAIPSALAAVAIAVFWIGQVTFGVHAVWTAVGLVAVLAVLAHRAGGRPNWRAVAAGYGVFAVGFCLLVALRTANPGITPAGGEQFLHFGLVKALERAPSLPPEDFWFAGEPLRYYYGTQLQVAALSMLTGTDPRYGFNLGIAAFYGVLFVVAYGLVGAVVADRGRSYRLGGATGAFFVALAGPTTTALRLVTPLLPEPISTAVARGAFGFAAGRFFDGDLERTVAELSDPGTWTWWFTRYVVPGTIQEVPLYSFVKADLHGHALSTGYVLFAGALAYAYHETPADQRRHRAGILAGLAGMAGVFGFMNTWALPTAGGLAALAVAAADAHPATLVPGAIGARLRPPWDDREGPIPWALGEGWRLVLGAAAGAVVVLAGVAVAAPFLVFGNVPSNEGIGLFPPRSRLGPFLVIYAGLLALFGVAVARRGWPAVADVDRRVLAAVGGGYLVVVLPLAVLGHLGVVAVVAPLLAGGWVLARSDRGDFGLVLLVAGVGLVLSLEFVHARLPHIDPPRWNTALKVAVQGWTLAAAGAAATVATLLAGWIDRVGGLVGRRQSDSTGPAVRRRPLRSGVVAVLVVAVVLASAAFPVLVVHDELGEAVAGGDYEPTIDGLSTVERNHPDEMVAYAWLERRSGRPTIVEAPGPPYSFTSPASTFSGLPTVIGWDHQVEYRSPEAYERRVSHVDAIYTGEWSVAARYLDRYDVAYVVVGPNERERYGNELRSFEHPAFDVAFRNDAVTVYRVDRSRLDESIRSVDRDAAGRRAVETKSTGPVRPA